METEAAATMLGIMDDNSVSSTMVVVNAPIPQRRVSSFTSTVSSEDEDSEGGGNPLLRLVDAASRLEPGEQCEAGTTDSGVEHEETNQETNMAVDEAQAMQEEFKRTTVQQTHTPTSSSASSSSAAAIKVITGTKEDLIMSPNQKMSFAEQLYDVLDTEQHYDVLQWMPDGLSFTITNHKKFTLDKMPKLFNIRNMSSFVRKLGRWGFSRVHEKATNNSDIFKHPEFIRNERENVKRRVKCLGRANISGSTNNNDNSNSTSSPGARSAAPHHQHQLQQQHHHNNNHHHRQGSHPIMMRQPDFVVPSKVSNTNRFPEVYSDHPVSPVLQQHHAFGAYPRGGGGGGGGVTHPSMDKVTAASAASAEALYLCHQQQQQARMEQLAMEQHELEDREIQNLMKQRAVRIRQRLQADQHQQQRHFVDTTHHHQQQQHHHQRMQRNASDGIPPPPLLQRIAGIDGQSSPSSQPRQSSSSPPATGAVGGGTDSINNSAVSSPRMEADRLHLPHLRHQHQHQQQQQQQHHQQHHLHQPKPHQAMTMMGNMDIRSPIIQSPLGRQSSFLDDRQAYGGTFTGGPTDDSPPRHVSPGTGEQSLRVNMSYDQLSPEELRSMERKAAIRALLKEEQEWETSLRGSGGGGSGSGGMGGGQHHQRRTSYNNPMMLPQGGGAWQQHEQHQLQPPLSPQEIHQGNAPPFYR